MTKTYPPQGYYLSYSLSVSYFLYATTIDVDFKGYFYTIIHFLSRYSLSIYLWHIFFLYLFELNKINMPWYCLYVTVLALSSATAYGVQMCKDKIKLGIMKMKKIPKSDEASSRKNKDGNNSLQILE